MPATSRNLYGNITAVGRRWVAGSFRSLNGFNATRNDFNFYFKVLYGGELIAGGSPVSEKCMETCFSSNVAGGSLALESYMETRLNSATWNTVQRFSS